MTSRRRGALRDGTRDGARSRRTRDPGPARVERGASGFTLIELMVTLTAALFFSVSVFMLTRDASRFFEREARVSDATIGTTAGFRRLAADVARAGFLASPNLAKDPLRCPNPAVAGATGTAPASAGYPSYPWLQRLGMLRVFPDGSRTALPAGDALDMLDRNGLTPDRLVLYGNYASDEVFPVAGYTQAAGQTTFTLEVGVSAFSRSGALFRTGYFGLADQTQRQALLARLFPVGRILRVANQIGEEQYAIIGQVIAPADVNTPPTIQTSAAGPQLVSKVGNVCGTRGLNDGMTLNTVNIINYQLRNVNDATAYPTLAPLFAGQRHPRDVATRLDLVRSELDPSAADPTDFAGTIEVVAENVVDLRVGLEAVSNQATRAVTFYPNGNGLIPRFAGDPTTGAAAAVASGPHLIRGVRVRLSTRAAAPDRDAAYFGDDVGAGLYRVALSWSGTTLSDFARVRTLETTVATRNSRNVLW